MKRLLLPRRRIVTGIAALAAYSAIKKAEAQFNGCPAGFCAPASSGGVSPFTWDPLNAAPGITLANSNRALTGTTAGTYSPVRTTIGKISGVWYCETVVTANALGGPDIQLGIVNATFPLITGNYLGHADKSAGYDWSNQTTFSSASITVANAITGTQTITPGDLIQLLMDLTTSTGKMWLGQNNVW